MSYHHRSPVCVGSFCTDLILNDVWSVAPSREVGFSLVEQLRIRGHDGERRLRELFDCSLKRNLSGLSCQALDFEWYQVADTLSTQKAIERKGEIYSLLNGQLPLPGKGCEVSDPNTQTKLRSCPLWAGYGNSIPPSVQETDWLAMAERWSAREEYDYAMAAFLHFIETNGTNPIIDLHLASISGVWGQTEIAIALYGRVIATTDNELLLLAARLNAILTLPPVVPNDPEAEQIQLKNDLDQFNFQKIFKTPIKDETILLRHIGRTLFHAAHRCSYHEVEIQKKLATLLQRLAPRLTPIPPAAVRRRRVFPRKVIKIGFVSAYLSEHSIGKMLAELIAQLSQHFEIYIFHLDQHSDHVSQFIDSNVAKSQLLDRTLSLQVARDSIIKAELDILIYTDLGMEAWSFFLAFSRLAPIQCVWWGHPVTSGLASIDYFLSLDSEVSDAQSLFYSEQLIRFQYINTAPFVQVDLQASADNIDRNSLLTGARFGPPESSAAIYLVLGRLFKLHPKFDDVLLRILDTDPTGIIALIIEPQRFILHDLWSRLQKRALFLFGNDLLLRRIRFLHYWKYIEILSIATLVLDTYPYGGCLTALDAMSNGVPLVTLPSTFERGRFAASIYAQMNFTHLVARDADDFISIVTRLGTDATFRDQAIASLQGAYPQVHHTRDVANEWANLRGY